MKAEKPRKVLIISSSGGGGCIQAAVAKEQEERAKDPHVVVINRDIMKDWYLKLIGKLGVSAWNLGQRKGNVILLECLQKCQPVGDVLFWLQYFSRFLRLMLKEDIDHVIDTQPQGTSAFLFALRVYNRMRKKNVILEKIIVDLPTDKNTHFFRPIKSLSKKNKKLLRMVSIPPLLSPGQSAEDFWRRHCNISERDVVYQKYVIRRAFCKIQGRQRDEMEFSFTARFDNPEEKRLLTKTLQRGTMRAEVGEHSARFFIAPQDRLITISLGSQPSYEATLGYVRRLLRVAMEPDSIRTPIHMIVFCSYHKMGEDSLLRAVADLILRMKDFPDNVTVVPLGFQDDETVAQVFHRSDLTCTRSGGQTSMELMCVMNGEIWIHSEAKKPAGQSEELSMDQLLKGIPGWEAGSALYLHRLWNAKIVTPDTFVPHGRKALSKKAVCRSQL
ncbi:MAG: hypothetical protein HW387_16 [Parachlamydiales bacterium]|nr:hypothetical protein [Parachlamydiales bacterium]